MSALHLDRIHHRIAAVLLANLAGLFLDKRCQRIAVAANFFYRLSIGFAQRLVEGCDLLTLGRRARALYREPLIARLPTARTVAVADEAVNRMLRFVLFANAHTLHREDRIRRPAVALFANPHFLAPQVAFNRIALCHLVVLEAPRKT